MGISNVFITVILGSNNQNKVAEAQLESFWRKFTQWDSTETYCLFIWGFVFFFLTYVSNALWKYLQALFPLLWKTYQELDTALHLVILDSNVLMHIMC